MEQGTLRLSQDSAMVWTERMLEALGRGNEGRQWHTLIDKVFSPKTLALAFASVTKRDRAAGIDGITTQAMRQREAEELPVIERLLSRGPLRTAAGAQHPAQAGQAQGARPGSGSQPVSQCLVRWEGVGLPDYERPDVTSRMRAV